MGIAIAIYLTGAVAWFGGVAMEAEISVMKDRDTNPYNHATGRMPVMIATAALWPAMLARVLPSTLYFWTTSKTHKAKEKL